MSTGVATPTREGRPSHGITKRGKTCAHVSADTSRGDSSAAPAGGRLTLEQRLDSVWEGLQLARAAECPVCHGELSSSAAGMTACCTRCGSTLS